MGINTTSRPALLLLSVLLFTLTTTSQNTFTTQQARRSWSNAIQTNPDAQKFLDYCVVVGKSDTSCANTFLSNDLATGISGRQSGINCMNKFATSSRLQEGLMGLLNVAGSSVPVLSPQRFPPKWYVNSDGKWEIKIASPSDLENAMQLGGQQGAKDGESFYKVSTLVIQAQLLVDKALLSAWSPRTSDYSDLIIDRLAEPFLPNRELMMQAWEARGRVDGAQNPEKYTDFTGTYVEGDETAVDAAGRAFLPTNFPSAPSTPPPPAPPVTSNPDPFDDIEESIPFHPDLHPGIVDVDPNGNDALNNCITEEEAKIIKALETVDFAPPDFITDDGHILDDAEFQLLFGMCSKAAFGEAECMEWARRIRGVATVEEPVSTGGLENLQNVLNQNGLCAPGLDITTTTCEEAHQAASGEFVFDSPWELKFDVQNSLNSSGGRVVNAVPFSFDGFNVEGGGAQSARQHTMLAKSGIPRPINKSRAISELFPHIRNLSDLPWPIGDKSRPLYASNYKGSASQSSSTWKGKVVRTHEDL